VDVQEENTSNIWRIIRTHNGCLPMVLILFINWSSWAVGGWIFAKIDKLFLNSFDSW
jgi:hypothetical protein